MEIAPLRLRLLAGFINVAQLAMALPVLIPPRHQALPDLLAGTVVVVDR